MEKPTYSTLVQCGFNNMISPVNIPDAWQLYAEKLSFRSELSGHIVIMDSEFFDQMPPHLVPIPCAKMVIIPVSPYYTNIGKGIVVAETLAQALTYQDATRHQAKHFIACSPFLFDQTLALKEYENTETVIMRTDRSYEKNRQYPALKKPWKKIAEQTAQRASDQFREITFSLYRT